MLADALPSACCRDTFDLVLTTLRSAACPTCGTRYHYVAGNDDAPNVAPSPRRRHYSNTARSAARLYTYGPERAHP